MLLAAEAATQYNRRGMVQNERGAIHGESSVQVPTKDGGFAAVRAWGNVDLTNTRGVRGCGWTRRRVHGNRSLGLVLAAAPRSRLALGVANYSYTSGAELPFGERSPTTEVFLSASREVAGFTPTLTLHYDNDKIGGIYLHGAIQRGFELSEGLRLDTGVSLGYSDGAHSFWAYDVHAWGLADLRGTMRLSFDLDHATTLTLGVAGSTILDNGIQRWFDAFDVDEDQIWPPLG